MTLTEVLGLGDLVCLAADDWCPMDEPTGLRCLVLGNVQGTQVASVVVEPESQRVWVLELVDELATAQWVDPDLNYSDFPGVDLTDTQALSILAEILRDSNDPT